MVRNWCIISMTWALTQGFSGPRRDQQMKNSFFKAVTPSPGSGRLFTEWHLEEKKTPMDQNWGLAEVFCCRWMILLMKEDEQQGSQSGIWVTSYLLLSRHVTWVVHMSCAQKGLMLGLILCCHCLEILNNFIFELVFCKSSLWENAWVEKTCVLCMFTTPCRPTVP